MAFTFALMTADGYDAGTIQTAEANLRPADIVIAQGNRRYKVTAVIPLPRVEEFVNGASVGLLEVEPL